MFGRLCVHYAIRLVLRFDLPDDKKFKKVYRIDKDNAQHHDEAFQSNRRVGTQYERQEKPITGLHGRDSLKFLEFRDGKFQLKE